MVNHGEIERERVPSALVLLANMAGDRVPLGPLLLGAYELYDRVGAHDVFYVVIARERGCPLLTVDGALARAAEDIGVDVRYHEV
jgi:predicted nucleic acid-binding protein